MKLSSFTIVLIFLILVITGLALIPLLPYKLKPSDTLPSVTVSYTWSGADPRTIEQEVTTILEGAFNRVRGVKKTSTSSSVGKGSVTIDFDNTVNFDAIRFEIASLVRQLYPTFPTRVSYPQISVRRPDKESSGPILSYTLNAPTAPYLIQKYAENKISPAISSIKGIEDIKVYGATPMEWVMEYDIDWLKTMQVTTSDIQTALTRYFTVAAAGLGYETGQRQDTTVIHLVFRNYESAKVDLLHIPVKRTENRVVYLKDLVTIKHQEQEPESFYRINGANTINILIYAGEQENQIQLSKRVKEKIAEIEKGLPSGYFLMKSYDATEFINQELMKNVWRALLTITILLLFVLVVTRSWRYLLLIVLSLIANLSIAAIFYYLFKMEMHIYSLAGLTVSLSLIKNNSIVMIDHWRHQRNLKVFMAILAATLTAIAALIVAFFLDDKLRLSLFDFSVIVIINLAVSLFIALFLIPALMEKIPLSNLPWKKRRRLLLFWRKPGNRNRLTVKFTHLYGKMIAFICRFKWILFVLAILGFGLPVYMLPDKIDSDTWLAQPYNKTLGSDWYKETGKPIADKVLGGALRLFTQDVFENSYYGEIEKTTLYANAQMDHGSTLAQMNELVTSIEKYLNGFNEIEQFRASISAGQASITVYFKKEFEDTGFPFQLKEMITEKAIELGGADWNVQGVGEGFNNAVRESLGQYRVTMYGYNYDDLFSLAEKVKMKLMQNPRVKDVAIMSRNAWTKDLSFEYVMDFDPLKLISANVSPTAVYASLQDFTKGEKVIGSTIVEGEAERIRLVSTQSNAMDLWQVQHTPGKIGKTMVRLANVSSIKKEVSSQDIVKENQQYKLILAYDYIGENQLAKDHQKQVMEEVEPGLPFGYTIQGDNNRGRWDKKSTQQYWWLLLIIVIIFFICSVLFESLRLPLAVILMIPISYIGIFLTFPLFNLNFDQGGFAAFLLLSGITVNSALYIINDFNNLKRKHAGWPYSALKLYMKAYNQKIFPILLTILSTSLGLVPFLMGGPKEVFWPALAAGTIGGLLFSLIGLWLFLPMFLLRSPDLGIKSPNRSR
jgi:multidrug efflux pump subunit AcrB